MALNHCQFFSDLLGMQTDMTVVLPQSTYAHPLETPPFPTRSGKFPVLWLLHGLSDDHSSWTRRTSIERYAETYGIAVVMPNVHRSFYTNMKFGSAYWNFISDELPRIARTFFPLSDDPEDNFVAGLSMGGYGAFKLGLRQPDHFAGAASLSGVLDLRTRIQTAREELDTSLRLATLKLVVGDGELAAEDDLLHLAGIRAQAGNGIPMLQICGTEDFLYSDNLTFRDHAASLGLNNRYQEGPGTHEWGFWDREIQTVLTWVDGIRRGSVPE